MNDDSIRDLLRVLGEADASAEAPPEIELRLRKKFRAHRRRRALRHMAPWTLLAPAAAVIVLLFVFVHRKPAMAPVNQMNQMSQMSQMSQMNQGPIHTAAARALGHTLPPQPGSPSTAMPVRKSVAAPPRQPEEIDTDFFLLMDPAPPFERGKMLRVELPASAMEMVGLPVNEEHLADSVQADVLIGEEGLPRAIRFVKFEMK
jgi:hypothetical protein